MTTISAEIRDRLRSGVAAARVAHRSGDRRRCRELLEGAHVSSQPWAVSHVSVHGSMLAAGARERHRREASVQLVRLVVAGPAPRPTPIRDDLAEVVQVAGR
jgi:hypothetical protein